MGTVSDPVPVTAFVVNFSPMPRMAPPPLGNVICGAVNAEFSRPGACPGAAGDPLDDGSSITYLPTEVNGSPISFASHAKLKSYDVSRASTAFHHGDAAALLTQLRPPALELTK